MKDVSPQHIFYAIIYRVMINYVDVKVQNRELSKQQEISQHKSVVCLYFSHFNSSPFPMLACMLHMIFSL